MRAARDGSVRLQSGRARGESAGKVLSNRKVVQEVGGNPRLSRAQMLTRKQMQRQCHGRDDYLGRREKLRA